MEYYYFSAFCLIIVFSIWFFRLVRTVESIKDKVDEGCSNSTFEITCHCKNEIKPEIIYISRKIEEIARSCNQNKSVNNNNRMKIKPINEKPK